MISPTPTPTPRLESAGRCPRCASLLWPAGSPCTRCPAGKPASPAQRRVTAPAVKRSAAPRAAGRAHHDEYAGSSLSIMSVSIICLLLLLAVFHFFNRLSLVSRCDNEVRQGSISGVQDLCTREPRLLNARGYLGRTPLYWAALTGQQGVMHWLLDQQAQVNLADQQGWTPLHVAANHGQVGAIEQLLQAGANPWARDAQGWTPLHAAAAGGHVDAVRCLTEESPLTLDERDYHGLTPLHVAVLAGQVAVVDHILQTGGDINQKTNAGDTALDLAKTHGKNSDIISLLTNHSNTAPSDTAQSSTAQSDTAQSDTVQSSTAQSDTVQGSPTPSSTAQSGTAQAPITPVTPTAQTSTARSDLD